MASASLATAAPITVTVGDDIYELKPTLAAVRSINAALGGLRPALQRIRDIDYDAFAAVIVAGAGLKLKAAQATALVEAVWQSPNRMDIGSAAVDYLLVLLNGGSAPTEVEPGTEEPEGNGSP